MTPPNDNELEILRAENARLRQSIRDLVTRFDATADHELKWGSRNCGLGWHDAARELEKLVADERVTSIQRPSSAHHPTSRRPGC